MIGVMLRRFLYDADGHVRIMRLIPLLGVMIMLATFGTLGIVATPGISQNAGVQLAWVLTIVVVLKLPLIFFLWWLIWRNKEWPGRSVRWSGRETREILDYLEARSVEAEGLPDAPARLAYLSREAWHVADQVEGPVKVDALTVALRIDERAAHVRERRGAR
jgi:hypothetical protein